MSQSKVGRIAVIAVSTCVGIGLGLLVGNALKQELLVAAVAIGALTGTPIGVAIALSDRKWVTIALILDLWVLSYVNGQWIGLGLAIAVAGLALYTAAIVTRDMFGASNDLDALWKQVLLIFHWTHGLQEIDGGKTVMPSKSGRLLGPQHIKIRPGNAIVLAKGRKPESGCWLDVIGPGDFTSGVGDYVAAVFDLRKKQKLFAFESVQTADAVQVAVQIEVYYMLNVRQAVCQGDQGINDDEKQLLRDIAVVSFDWDTATKCAVENSVRNVIGRTQSEQLLKGQSLERLGRQIRQHALRTTLGQGIFLHSLIIHSAQKA